MEPIAVIIEFIDAVVHSPDILGLAIEKGLNPDPLSEWEDIAALLMRDDSDIVSICDEDSTVFVYPDSD